MKATKCIEGVVSLKEICDIITSSFDEEAHHLPERNRPDKAVGIVWFRSAEDKYRLEITIKEKCQECGDKTCTLLDLSGAPRASAVLSRIIEELSLPGKEICHG